MCVCVWLLSFFEAEREESYVAEKITNCGKSAGSSHETPIGAQLQCRAPLSPLRLAVRFNSQNISGRVCRGTKTGVRISPNIVWKPVEEGKLFILSVATTKEPESYRITASPAALSDSTTSRVEVSVGAGTEPALSYQPGDVKQGRVERVSQ